MTQERAGFSWLWLSAVIVAADQLTKWIATSTMTLHERVAVLPFFDWTLTYNRGVAFSLFNDGQGWQRFGLSAFALIVAGGFTYWMAHLPKHERGNAVALALVIGGAIGNVIDRVRFGHVVDFIDLHYAGAHFPAFNIADSAISVGAVILIVFSLFGGHAEAAKKA